MPQQLATISGLLRSYLSSVPQLSVPQSYLSPSPNAEPFLLHYPPSGSQESLVLRAQPRSSSLPLPHFSIPCPHPSHVYSVVMLCHFLSRLSPFLQVSKPCCSFPSLWLSCFFWPWPCLRLLVTCRWSLCLLLTTLCCLWATPLRRVRVRRGPVASICGQVETCSHRLPSRHPQGSPGWVISGMWA